MMEYLKNNLLYAFAGAVAGWYSGGGVYVDAGS